MAKKFYRTAIPAILIFTFLTNSCGKRGSLIPRNELVPSKPVVKKIFVDNKKITIFFKVPSKKIQNETIKVRAIEIESIKRKKMFSISALRRFKNYYALEFTGNIEYFRLRSWSEYGAGRYTRWFYIPENPLKKQPSITNIKLIENGVQFSWKSQEKLEGIILYIGTRKDRLNLFNLDPISEKNPVITSLPLHKWFHIVIQGAITCEKNFLCLTPLSREVTFFTKDIVPPPSPSDLNFIRKNDKIYLFWTQINVDDFKEYRIYRKNNLRDKWTLIGKSKINRFIDSSCRKEKKCYYTISAIDIDGNESGFSNFVVTGGENESLHVPR